MRLISGGPGHHGVEERAVLRNCELVVLESRVPNEIRLCPIEIFPLNSDQLRLQASVPNHPFFGGVNGFLVNLPMFLHMKPSSVAGKGQCVSGLFEIPRPSNEVHVSPGANQIHEDPIRHRESS